MFSITGFMAGSERSLGKRTLVIICAECAGANYELAPLLRATRLSRSPTFRDELISRVVNRILNSFSMATIRLMCIS